MELFFSHVQKVVDVNAARDYQMCSLWLWILLSSEIEILEGNASIVCSELSKFHDTTSFKLKTCAQHHLFQQCDTRRARVRLSPYSCFLLSIAIEYTYLSYTVEYLQVTAKKKPVGFDWIQLSAVITLLCTPTSRCFTSSMFEAKTTKQVGNHIHWRVWSSGNHVEVPSVWIIRNRCGRRTSRSNI